MAITIVQTATNNSSPAATGLAVPISTPTAGNRIIAVLQANTINSNVSEVTGLFVEDKALNIGGVASGSIWSKLSDGTETVVQWAFSASCLNEAIVYEVSGLTQGPVYVDASFSAGPGTSTSVTAGPVAAIRANNEFISVGVAFINTSGAFVSVTNSYVFDGPVSANNRLIPAHLIQTVANATQQTVVTWTTSRPPGALLVAYLGNEIDFLPAAVTFRNQGRRRRLPARRGTTLRRTFGGTPSMHDVRIPRRRRPVQRARRPDFIQDTPDVAPLPHNFDIITTRRRRKSYRRNRPSIWSVPVTAPVVTPPGIILELIRAQVRPRFKYTQRHGLFIYPLPPSVTPPPIDPIVIEPIRGFLLTDGKTTGLLITDGHTTGFLITDGKTTTVLLS